MATMQLARPNGCLPPVPVPHVTDTPESIRAMACATDGGSTLDAALARFTDALDEPIAATGPSAQHDPARRDQLTSRWAGYVSG